jgi:hypothetical protein
MRTPRRLALQQVGEPSVSYRLAHAFGVGLPGVDDSHITLLRHTTQEHYPAVHGWSLHAAEALHMDDEQRIRRDFRARASED